MHTLAFVSGSTSHIRDMLCGLNHKQTALMKKTRAGQKTMALSTP